MIKDPAVQAIVNGGTSQFLTRRQRIERYVLWFLVVAVIALGGGYLVVNGVAHQAQDASAKASASVQASCQFWHDLALVPSSAASTKTLFTILADARIAYSGLNCVAHTGELPAPDPSVAALLPPGMH